MAVLQEAVFDVVLVAVDFVVVVCAWHYVLEQWVEPDLTEWAWFSEEQDLLLLEGRGLLPVELHFRIQVLRLGLAAQAVTCKQIHNTFS